MRIDLQYWIGPTEYLAREYLLSRDPIQAVFAGYRRETLEYLVLCLFTGFVAWHTQEVVFVFIALGFIAYKVAWFFQVRREFPKAFKAQIQKLAPREIQLTIDDDGLHETVEGVKSFAALGCGEVPHSIQGHPFSPARRWPYGNHSVCCSREGFSRRRGRSHIGTLRQTSSAPAGLAMSAPNNALNCRSLRSLDSQKLRFCLPVSLIVRYHMLSRYPKQTRSRRGFALVGATFLVFGIVMALVDSAIGASIGVLFGATLLLPSVLFGESGFERFEKALSRIVSFGSLS